MRLNLSIIIPAYNVQEWIGECLDSMKGLSRDDFEVIVVNDGSTDKTKEIVQSYADSFKHFQVLDQVNQGLSLARNNGLSIAKGMYVFFCDSDDYIDPKEFNEFLINTLELGVDVSVGNGLNLFGSELKGQIKKSDIISSLGILDGPSFYLKANQADEFIITAWIRIYRREFLEENNLVFYPSIIHEDEEFAPKVFCFAGKVVYLDKNFYIRRHRIGSITKNTRHKYYNPKSCPSFIRVMDSLRKFLNSKVWSRNQIQVITHGIHKCHIEILRRELYFAKEKIKELQLQPEQKKKIQELLVGVSYPFIFQRILEFRLKFKLLIFSSR